MKSSYKTCRLTYCCIGSTVKTRRILTDTAVLLKDTQQQVSIVIVKTCN